MTSNCFVCDKHLEDFDELFIDFEEFDQFKVGHAPDRSGTSEVYLGALIIEPIRHVEHWGELFEEESIQLGLLIKEVLKLLLNDENVEHIYTWVFGDALEHMHIWIVPRYVNTPKEFWGVKLDEWPDAPKGGALKIKEKVLYLRLLT
jgi:diadenosine tetraphosphate (Ap4A) HIT family hydrolase